MTVLTAYQREARTEIKARLREAVDIYEAEQTVSIDVSDFDWAPDEIEYEQEVNSLAGEWVNVTATLQTCVEGIAVYYVEQLR